MVCISFTLMSYRMKCNFWYSYYAKAHAVMVYIKNKSMYYFICDIKTLDH